MTIKLLIKYILLMKIEVHMFDANLSQIKLNDKILNITKFKHILSSKGKSNT